MADVSQEKLRRWFRVTPDRVVLALLAVEGFLLLSERFGWFAFNRQKGWTMLIDMASVAAALLLMLLWFMASLVFRRRFQFSIRSLLLLTLAIAVPCSWFAAARQQARKQREVVDEIKTDGGSVMCEYEIDPSSALVESDAPSWLEWPLKLFGDDMFANVRLVSLGKAEGIDAWLERLNEFPQLRYLDCSATDVSDAGLQHLKGLAKLDILYLSNKVSNAGIADIQKALPNTQIRR